VFGMEELKERIEVEGDTVICPVVGCRTRVGRMTRGPLKSLDGYLGTGPAKGGDQVFPLLSVSILGRRIQVPPAFVVTTLWRVSESDGHGYLLTK